MKITQPTTEVLAQIQSSEASKQRTEVASSANQSSAKVELSQASIEAQAISAPFNVEKISKLLEAIRNGDYSVNAASIAEKIMRIETDMRGE